MPLSVKRVKVLKLQESSQWIEDNVVAEEPLRLSVNGKPIYILRTPGEDVELALGFLFSQGAISNIDDVIELRREQATVIVKIRGNPPERDLINSACGMCGAQELLNLVNFSDNFKVRLDVLLSLPFKMRERQALFNVTGGIHAAALFSPEGNLLWLSEDVGRHNAVDKVIGHFIIEGNIPKGILQVSGRAGYEIVQKAGAAKIPVLSAVSAPSSMAVDAADLLGLTLVGFSRGERVNIYSHPERIMM